MNARGDGTAPVALVTGAARGIGREVARQLAERGHVVVLTARDEAKATAAAEELSADTGGTVVPRQLDVADPASVERMAAAVAQDPGRLDVLVNNAGIVIDGGVAGAEPDFDAIQTTLDTNFFGAYRAAVALLPLLRRSAHRRIVNVSSGMGGVAEQGGWVPGYRVSKAALNAMTRLLATEAFGARVAMVRLAEGAPDVLLADHLEGERPILVYRVADLDAAVERVRTRGGEPGPRFGIPHGPCCEVATPGGHRVALYELTRPEVGERLAGRRDF